MGKTIKTYGHIRALSAQQLLALIGHAPNIEGIGKLSEKDRVLDRNDKTPREDVFRVRVEKVRGKKLHRFFATEKNEENIEEVAKQLGSILGFLHKNGMGHNDFRRRNIVVEKKKGKVTVKVFDNETINIIGHDLEFLRKKKFSTSGTKISYGNLKTRDKTSIKVSMEGDFYWENWKKTLEKAQPERRKKVMKTLLAEYERELMDSPMKFRGKPIHEMKPKSRFVRDLKK